MSINQSIWIAYGVYERGYLFGVGQSVGQLVKWYNHTKAYHEKPVSYYSVNKALGEMKMAGWVTFNDAVHRPNAHKRLWAITEKGRQMLDLQGFTTHARLPI